MKKMVWLLGLATMSLAACETYDAGDSDQPTPFIKQLPKGVLEIAAPYQDLEAVRIDPSTGCYVYQHVGPVETTFLPLRTETGSPICTRKL